MVGLRCPDLRVVVLDLPGRHDVARSSTAFVSQPFAVDNSLRGVDLVAVVHGLRRLELSALSGEVGKDVAFILQILDHLKLFERGVAKNTSKKCLCNYFNGV